MKEKKPINVEIGQNVKQIRESAGLTQESFAELIGLGEKHVSAIERGADSRCPLSDGSALCCPCRPTRYFLALKTASAGTGGTPR